MTASIFIKIGDFLYKNAFPIYNFIYPIFKKNQDKHEIKLLKKYVIKGDIVFDIGGNIGFYTKILSELVGKDGKVYTFEPDETNFLYLKKNTGNLKNVELVNKAVSYKTGAITLFHSDLLNVDHKTYVTDDYISKTEVECVALDDFIPNQKVDFIKIDIQGFEYFAFQGMKEIFKKNENLKIITELYPYGLNNSGINVDEFISFLKNNAFYIYKMSGNKLSILSDKDISNLNNENYRIHMVDILLSKKPINETLI